MALTNALPRKVVPLSGGEDTRPQTPAGTSNTTRAFFCGVVVESGSNKELSSGAQLKENCQGVEPDAYIDLRGFVASLGEHLSSEDGTVTPAVLHETTPPELTRLSVCSLYLLVIVLTYQQSSTARKRALTNSSALSDVLNEFVSTERSYVKRLRILKEVCTRLNPVIELTWFPVICRPVAHVCPYQRHSSIASVRGQNTVWKY